MVAGAKKDALIEDFQNAIDQSINGLPYKGWLDKHDVYHPGFLDLFDEIVEKHGWSYNGSRGWRSRVIYETNLKSAFAAGRLKQMREPAVLKVFPYWQYVHGMDRDPLHPREEHLNFDGLVLNASDPFWEIYYPPNGWKCSCGVRPVSKTKLNRLGKSEPDKAPVVQYVQKKDTATGELIEYPKGVDLGWGYTPGRTWAEGLVPRELQKPLLQQMELPGLDALTPLQQLAKPLDAVLLPAGKDDTFYLSSFLKKFSAEIGKPKLFRDRAGQALLISDDLFRERTGKMKIMKRGREIYIEQLAEAIKDPDEIWVNWIWHDKMKKWILDRRFIRLNPENGLLAIFEWSNLGWSGTTVYKSDSKQVERRRNGALLYRRKK